MPAPPFLRPSQLARIARRSVVALAACCALALLLFSGPRARADSAAAHGFVVVIHAKNPANSVTQDFLSDAFLKKTTRWDGGVTLKPADQRRDSDVRRAFSTAILKRSVEAVRIYWQQRIFSGREIPPPEFDSDAAVLRFVTTHEGAIGYVSPTAPLAGAKSVTVR